MWFRCAYCPKDLCDSCAEVDTHDNTHLFVVFKSEVNMQIFRCVCPPLAVVAARVLTSVRADGVASLPPTDGS